MLLRRQAEPALSGKRERAGIAGDFPHHEGQVTAPQPFFQREQRVLGRGRGDMDQPVAQRARQAGAIRPPGLPQGGAILHPQPRPLIPQRGALVFQRQGKGRAGTVLRAGKQLGMAGLAGGKRERGRQRGNNGWGNSSHANRDLYVLIMFRSAELARGTRLRLTLFGSCTIKEGDEAMHYDQGDPAELKEKFWKALAASPFLMLQLDAEPDSAAPMTAQLDKDANSAIWFFTSPDNRFATGGSATGTFSSKGHDAFARITGELSEETSRERKDALWSNMIEAWFPAGKDSALLLRMDLGDAAIWAGELGAINTAKMFLGMNVRDNIKGGYTGTQL
jgi:general stress protein 26